MSAFHAVELLVVAARPNAPRANVIELVPGAFEEVGIDLVAHDVEHVGVLEVGLRVEAPIADHRLGVLTEQLSNLVGRPDVELSFLAFGVCVSAE